MSPVTIKKTNKEKKKDKGKTKAQYLFNINPRRKKKSKSKNPLSLILTLILFPDILADSVGGSSPWEANLRCLCARNLGRF